VRPPAGAERTLARTAGFGAGLVFVVVASSAWLRLATGDAGCPPGGCEAFALADAVRLAHRVAAMGVAVVALLVLLLSWRAPARPVRRVASVAILVLVGALSVVGRASAGNPPAGVVLANLAGGLALLALVTAVACDAHARALGVGGRLARAPLAVVVLLALSIAAGAALSAGVVALTPQAAAAHRITGWFALLVAAFLATSPSTPPAARGPMRLATGAFALSVVIALAGPGTELARWLHNVLSAAALVLSIAACARARAFACPPGAART